MTTITISGSISSALTHFTGLGLTAILHSAGLSSIRLWWSDENEPQLFVSVPDADRTDVETALGDHVRSMADHDAWVQRILEHEGRANTGLFSPRIRVPRSTDSWLHLQQQRHEAIDGLIAKHDVLSLSMIGSLGEPAYWRSEKRQNRPDEGASRWEMKTRNQGEEFVGNRLAPMASLLSRRSPAELLDGVTGDLSRDDVNGTAESRAATGLQRPGPVDTARAWAALWGLSSFPVVHQSHSISVTAGAFPQDRLHTRFLVIPVFARPTTLERWRALIASESLAELGCQIATDGEDTHLDAVASSQLAELGVAAIGTARVHLGGSSSAPERFVLDVGISPLEAGDRYGR